MQSYNAAQTNSQRSASTCATARTKLFQEPLNFDITSNYNTLLGFRYELVINNDYYFRPHRKITQIFFSSYILFLMIVCEN